MESIQELIEFLHLEGDLSSLSLTSLIQKITPVFLRIYQEFDEEDLDVIKKESPPEKFQMFCQTKNAVGKINQQLASIQNHTDEKINEILRSLESEFDTVTHFFKEVNKTEKEFAETINTMNDNMEKHTNNLKLTIDLKQLTNSTEFLVKQQMSKERTQALKNNLTKLNELGTFKSLTQQEDSLMLSLQDKLTTSVERQILHQLNSRKIACTLRQSLTLLINHCGVK